MPDPAVSIVIPSWNGRHILEEFLPSVVAGAVRYASVSAAVVEIVVVDDGSRDDTAPWLALKAAESPVPIRAVRHETNRGFGQACNTGMQQARYPLALLLNNDVELSRDAIAPLVAHFEAPGTTFAVHCQAIDLATNRIAGRGQAGDFRRGFLRVHDSYEPDAGAQPPFLSMFASGGSAMFDRKLFLELGGFDPLFAPFYYEDVELSLRAWKRGFEVHYEPASKVRHRFSSTIGASGRSHIRRISQRNRLFVHWIHLHQRGWFARHLGWVALLAVTSPLTLRPTFALSVFDAMRRWPEVRVRRRRERHAATRSDAEVLRLVGR